ncbi:MAG: InlB B-repeat-containing protein [Bacilli bacterium]|nr:InlB B-repeat-containing protein [Bacilli bacterium]
MKKGFTLIELIAVITIISIIALITTSSILDVIDTSKKKTALLTGEKIISAIKAYSETYELENGVPFYNQRLSIENHSFTGIDIYLNDILPEKGTVNISDTGGVTIAVYNDGYCVSGSTKNLNIYEGECIDVLTAPSFTIATTESIDQSTLTIIVNATVSEGQALATEAYSFDNGANWQSSNEHLVTSEIGSFNNTILVRDNTLTNISSKDFNISKLTIDANGGVISGLDETQIYWLEPSTIVSLSTPIKIGNTFNNWVLSSNSTTLGGLTYIMGSSEETLTANWTVNTYVLTVNVDGGTWSGTTPQELLYGTSTPISDPTKVGNSFVRWDKTGTGSDLTEGTFTIGNENATLTAIWSVNEYILTVDSNGGTWSGTTPQTLAYGTTIPINYPTKTNYTFTGWSKSNENSNIDETSFTMGDSNITLTATWLLTSCVLTVDANGGAWSGTTPQTLAIGSTTNIVNPTKSGSVFAGWQVSSGSSNISGTTFTMGNEDTTLTALWYTYEDMFTYTGTYTVIDDGNGNWRIKFLTSGTFTPKVDFTIDAFLVGGGGGGCSQYGGGGGGGYTATHSSIAITKNTAYTITRGSGGGLNRTGGTTTAFGYSVSGGKPGVTWNGGNGGSGGGGHSNDAVGGNGGSNGGNGGSSAGNAGGTGQGTTTREFGERTGTLYSGGGAGGGIHLKYNGGSGGSGGGAHGSVTLTYATANTGGGGGGGNGYDTLSSAYATGGASGIVVIRNHR